MTAEIIPFKEPRSLSGLAAKLPAVFLPDEKAAERFFGYFTANIRNKNTRRAYYKAALTPPAAVVPTAGRSVFGKGSAQLHRSATMPSSTASCPAATHPLAAPRARQIKSCDFLRYALLQAEMAIRDRV